LSTCYLKLNAVTADSSLRTPSPNTDILSAYDAAMMPRRCVSLTLLLTDNEGRTILGHKPLLHWIEHSHTTTKATGYVGAGVAQSV